MCNNHEIVYLWISNNNCLSLDIIIEECLVFALLYFLLQLDSKDMLVVAVAAVAVITLILVVIVVSVLVYKKLTR